MSKKLLQIFSLLFLLLANYQVFASAEESFEVKNFDSAFRKAYMSVEVEDSGSVKDLLILGKIYLDGLGASEQNSNKALSYISEAIKKGSAEAAFFLAEKYETGLTIEKSLISSLKLYKEAQELGIENLEEKIASLSKDLSNGNINPENCNDFLEAASKNEQDFYFLAAKCSILQNKDFETAEKYLEILFTKNASEYDDLIIDNLIDNESPLFSQRLAVDLVVKMDGAKAEKQQIYFGKIFQSISGRTGKQQYEQILKTLSNAYYDNPKIIEFFIQFLQTTINSRDPEISELALMHLLNHVNEDFNEDDRLKIISSVLASEKADANINEAISNIILENTKSFLKKKNSTGSEAKVFIKKRLENGFCRPAYFVFQTNFFNTAKLYAKSIADSNQKCIDGNFTDIKTGFKDFLNVFDNKKIDALKNLCSNEIYNGCYALGELYRNNESENISKQDSDNLSFQTYKKALQLGSTDAAVQLSFIYSKKGQRDDAIKHAKLAQENGLIDGFYAEANALLRKVFQGSKSCIPLLKFLSGATVDNPYYDDAVRLSKKKQCKG